MKVCDCEKCKHYRRKVWSECYKPLNYHYIGISHAYGYCELFRERCLNIKKCNL